MDSAIVIALIAGASSVVSALGTLWFTRRERKAQAAHEVANALQAISASYQGLLDAQKKRIDVLEESTASFAEGLEAERLARKDCVSKIEQLSERLDKADRLVRSLEGDLERERQARRAAEANIEDMSASIAALTEENAELQDRILKGLSDQ